MNIPSNVKFKINIFSKRIFFLKKINFHCICLQDLELGKKESLSDTQQNGTFPLSLKVQKEWPKLHLLQICPESNDLTNNSEIVSKIVSWDKNKYAQHYRI